MTVMCLCLLLFRRSRGRSHYLFLESRALNFLVIQSEIQAWSLRVIQSEIVEMLGAPAESLAENLLLLAEIPVEIRVARNRLGQT